MLNLCYFTSLICFYRNIFYFDTVRQQIANLPLLPRARLFNSRTEGLQEVVGGFSFCFLVKEDR